MKSLVYFQRLAVLQARRKKWNNSNRWLKKKFKEEVKEFLKAFDKGDPKEIVKEFSDVLVVGFQMCWNKAKKHNLDKAYVTKIKDNYANKKKTWDEKTQKVVRK